MNKCREMMHIDKRNRQTKQPYSFPMHIDKCLRPIQPAKEDETAVQLPDTDCNNSTLVQIQWKYVQKEKRSPEEFSTMSLFRWSHVWAYNQDTMQKEEREKGQGKGKKTCRTAATRRVGIVAMAAVGTVPTAILVAKVLISAMMPDCNAESCAHLQRFAAFYATRYVSCSILS